MNPTILISRQWWKTTLIVIIAVTGMIRLGIWQLDRLDQRRAFNTRVLEQLEQPELVLSRDAFSEDLESMEYRSVVVRGVYVHNQQVVLRNQAWESQLGVHLLTPLIIQGSNEAVLVDRGWVPFEDFSEEDLEQYDERGRVVVHGMIRHPQERAEIGGRSDPIPEPGGERLVAWNLVNVEGIASQTPYHFLPVYIQQAPEPSRAELPYRSLPELELTEGPHLGYAIQWFIFATILAVGYPLYVRREELSYKEAAKIKPSKFSVERSAQNNSDNRVNQGSTRI